MYTHRLGLGLGLNCVVPCEEELAVAGTGGHNGHPDKGVYSIREEELGRLEGDGSVSGGAEGRHYHVHASSAVVAEAVGTTEERADPAGKRLGNLCDDHDVPQASSQPRGRR